LVLVSAALQVVIFPLLGLHGLAWVAVAPLLIAIMRARAPETLQLQLGGQHQARLLPATAWQGFVLGYACGILFVAGSCYWIFQTLQRYGDLSIPAAALAMLLYCMYVGLFHGIFGLLLALIAGTKSVGTNSAGSKSKTKPIVSGASIRRALGATPFLWVAVELARTRIIAIPWEFLGYTQTSNLLLTRIATFTGVYGLSFEIALVNSVFAAAFLVVPWGAKNKGTVLAAEAKRRRRWLLVAACAAVGLLQAGEWLRLPPVATDHTAILMQPNFPIQDESIWTKEYFQNTLRDLTATSLHPVGGQIAAAASVTELGNRYDLIVWPESPTPFFTNDPLFRVAVSALARQSGTWVVAGAIGVTPALHSGGDSQISNSAALINPQGEWVGRYDKVHLVPFGEYLPYPKLFAFAGGLTKEVGDFQPGASRAPLKAGDERIGTFICFESMFPDEVRQFSFAGADVLVNISNDGWYGDSGAWKEHLQETRMRAIENGRWLLVDTNTGMTASVDPYGRIVAATPRKVRTALAAPYALSTGTTFYTRHGDWFAYLCAIISAGALLARFVFPGRVS
jgi:apolipoprotein N-acyltransferase